MIELLVVIVIIGILAALVVPGVNKALVQARFAESQSNLHQIGLALMLYSQDHEGKFPIARGSIPYDKTWQEGVSTGNASWQTQLIPYTGGNEKIFFSPYSSAYNPKGRKWSYFLGTHAAEVERQSQSPIPTDRLALNLNKITAPGSHILAGEDHRGIMDLTDSDKDDYDTNNPAFGYAGPDRKVNILFADGHIESPKRFDAKKMAVKYEGIDPSYTGYE